MRWLNGLQRARIPITTCFLDSRQIHGKLHGAHTLFWMTHLLLHSRFNHMIQRMVSDLKKKTIILLRDRFCTHSFVFSTSLFWCGKFSILPLPIANSLSSSLKNWRLYMLLLSYDWSESLKSYTNVTLTLSTTKAGKLVVNTCGRYFSLAKFESIKLLDKLMATETEVSAVLHANTCGLTAGKLTLQIITLR